VLNPVPQATPISTGFIVLVEAGRVRAKATQNTDQNHKPWVQAKLTKYYVSPRQTKQNTDVFKFIKDKWQQPLNVQRNKFCCSLCSEKLQVGK
jgi:hypothetical protein